MAMLSGTGEQVSFGSAPVPLATQPRPLGLNTDRSMNQLPSGLLGQSSVTRQPPLGHVSLGGSREHAADAGAAAWAGVSEASG
eukprot:CAMPEP_0174374208 /NCGR_PEP_ID=MMETSP0811_2-20130205/110075_1 /TAXON_ID=73025 ORGANISM="Eutreptiella gymnastica-like, Strain CCMP1594" /NCGR_SAMPLE_ID=MMETSP0811_2 /ASSEMBLY_ACC=CAM_ASM_000667 /LENGTH=82 /DNA_ID=CAMNT_0015523325 /DNA_START=82 /DNA_END=328 /DNA_ORIENTATION=-